MDLLTSNAATLALVAGAVVLLIGVGWAVSAPHAPGRRFVPRSGPERAVSAILLLDGCALLALGAVWHLDRGDAGAPQAEGARTGVSAQAPGAADPDGANGEDGGGPGAGGAGAGAPGGPDASAGPAGPADGAGSGDAAGSPDAPASPGAAGSAGSAGPTGTAGSARPTGPRRSRAILVARLSGDGVSPGRGNREARGGAWLDVRPARRHLCFDLAADRGIRGSITRAYVFRSSAAEGALPHLTLVVPDDKDARRRRGCADRPPAGALREVVDRPQDFHVTFFDEEHPEGAIRGTLRSCRRPCATRAPELLG